MIELLLRYKYPFLAIFLVLPLLFSSYSIYHDSLQETFKQAEFERASQTMRDTIRDKIADKQQSTLILALSLSAQFSDQFQNGFTQKEIHAFSDKNLKPIVTELSDHTEYQHIWFQITDAQGQSYYRSWSGVQEPLIKIRPEFSRLQKDPRPLVSVSSGRCDLTIKAIAPVKFNKRLVGFIEVISHFNSIQLDLEQKGIPSMVVATPERTDLITQPFGQYRLHGHYVANLDPDQFLLKTISQTDLDYWFNRLHSAALWNDYLVIRYPLMSIDQEMHGLFLAFQPLDTLMAVDRMDQLTRKQLFMDRVLIAAMISVVFIALLLVLFKQKKYYKAIMDEESEIVMISDGVSLKEANKSFFHYFSGFNDLKSFQKQYRCICDLFVEEEGFLQEKMGKLSWLDYLLQHPDQSHKVKMHYQGQEWIFDIKANCIPSEKGLAVVVLNDITESVKLNQKLLDNSLKDALTGISNRRHFNESFKKHIESAKRYQNSLCLIIFDIDFFKKVNDNFGHDVGDEVLKQLTQTVQDHLRESDELYRIGGEEFGVLLSHQSLDQAEKLAEKLRQEVEEADFSPVPELTISLGVAEYHGEPLPAFFKRADNALYEAKQSGRNCVKVGKPNSGDL